MFHFTQPSSTKEVAMQDYCEKIVGHTVHLCWTSGIWEYWRSKQVPDIEADQHHLHSRNTGEASKSSSFFILIGHHCIGGQY